MKSRVVGKRLRLIAGAQVVELSPSSKFISAEIDKFGVLLYFWQKVPFDAKPVNRRFVIVRTDDEFTEHARVHLFTGRCDASRSALHVFELKE